MTKVIAALASSFSQHACVTYALAFTTLPLRTCVAACAVALAPVVTIAMGATSWFLRAADGA